ncbi:hypothetical protein CL614_10285 [archaeon]|nr:hypothetical protein [archaeon]MAH44084.1 hypothetical protein [archaeon]|tara:strand:+ start:8019 stop:8267 length:249 start_codon:yes stop_codon:yes gene_type:complete
MTSVGGEYLEKIQSSVQKNVSCCRWAMENNKSVGILASGKYIEAKVSKLTWDDMEDLVWVESTKGEKLRFTGSQLTTVRIVS